MSALNRPEHQGDFKLHLNIHMCSQFYIRACTCHLKELFNICTFLQRVRWEHQHHTYICVLRDKRSEQTLRKFEWSKHQQFPKMFKVYKTKNLFLSHHHVFLQRCHKVWFQNAPFIWEWNHNECFWNRGLYLFTWKPSNKQLASGTRTAVVFYLGVRTPQEVAWRMNFEFCTVTFA